MRMTYRVSVNTPELRNLRVNAPGELSKAVRRASFAGRDVARMQAPVDTGALRASIHIVLYNMNDRAESNANARVLAARRGRVLMIAPARIAKTPWEGWISTGVFYAPYQERVRMFMKAGSIVAERVLINEVGRALRRARRRSI